jgi:hypothetical protein
MLATDDRGDLELVLKPTQLPSSRKNCADAMKRRGMNAKEVQYDTKDEKRRTGSGGMGVDEDCTLSLREKRVEIVGRGKKK